MLLLNTYPVIHCPCLCFTALWWWGCAYGVWKLSFLLAPGQRMIQHFVIVQCIGKSFTSHKLYGDYSEVGRETVGVNAGNNVPYKIDGLMVSW